MAAFCAMDCGLIIAAGSMLTIVGAGRKDSASSSSSLEVNPSLDTDSKIRIFLTFVDNNIKLKPARSNLSIKHPIGLYYAASSTRLYYCKQSTAQEIS